MFFKDVAIFSDNGKIHEFFEFANDIHKVLECEGTDCDIFKFLKPLEEVLSDETCCDYQKIVFVNQCMKYTNVFNSMFQHSKSENIKATLEEFKKKSPDQRVLEDQIEYLKNSN